MITIPASITIENGVSVQRYNWKSQNKTSVYRRKCRRAFVRITCANLAKRLGKKNKYDRQVQIKFNREGDDWELVLNRTKEKGATVQAYFGLHPYVQIVLNKHLPEELWKEHKMSNKKSYTRSVCIKFNLKEWTDIGLEPSDFLIEVEKLSKQLMKKALKHGFKIDFIPKGRQYDLELISPKGKRLILAISSHVAKNQSRNKEKRKQKILMDIAKILPILYNKKVYPVIISQPIDFVGSWSFTTDYYLNFYKEKFNFSFLTTDFKKGWEKDVCNKLLRLDNNGL